MARNAVRKLRTLRHPGVLKVIDTVEVRRYLVRQDVRVSMADMQCTDGDIHLHCYRKTGPVEMASQEEEHERGNHQVGAVQYSGWLKPPLRIFRDPADGHCRIR